MFAPFLRRRLLALALTVLIAISLTFLFFQLTIERVTAPGALASGLADYLERLLLHPDTGPSFLSPDIPVQQVLWEGLRVDLALLVGGTAVAAAWALPC